MAAVCASPLPPPPPLSLSLPASFKFDLVTGSRSELQKALGLQGNSFQNLLERGTPCLSAWVYVCDGFLFLLLLLLLAFGGMPCISSDSDTAASLPKTSRLGTGPQGVSQKIRRLSSSSSLNPRSLLVRAAAEVRELRTCLAIPPRRGVLVCLNCGGWGVVGVRDAKDFVRLVMSIVCQLLPLFLPFFPRQGILREACDREPRRGAPLRASVRPVLSSPLGVERELCRAANAVGGRRGVWGREERTVLGP